MSSIDLLIQDHFYNFETQQWILSINKEGITHFIFYDGIKRLLVLFAVFLLLALIFLRKNIWVKNNISGLIIVLLSLMIVPFVVSTIKNVSNVACPKALTHYGGSVPYVAVFEAYPNNQKPAKKQLCFPAAHASGGFALLSLFFLAQSIKRRKQAIFLALSIGWLMGGYKMLIGHHFLSHTVISMMLAWFLINIIAVVIKTYFVQYRINDLEITPQPIIDKT